MKQPSRFAVEILLSGLLLGICLSIRMPTGKEYQPTEAIGRVVFGEVEDEKVDVVMGRWEKMGPEILRLWTRRPNSAEEQAQSTLTWSGPMRTFTSPLGDLLISEGSQVWSRDPRGWRAWIVRDGWELESAKWRDSSGDSNWELQWRRLNEGESRDVQTEVLDRSLRRTAFEATAPSD